MLIQPDSYIRLIKNCPLDSSYKDTIYFDNRDDQTNYFKNTLQGIPFTKQSYQRYDKGVLHIQEKADNLYSCNYLMFQNTAFGNKWFYAFINSIEYINNVSSKVYYEIDVIQTWFFDLVIHPCFIERQHTLTDKIGDNLIAENLPCGDYIYDDVETWGNPEDAWDVIIQYQSAVPLAVTPSPSQVDIGPGLYGNTFQGCRFLRIRLNSAEDVESAIGLITSLNILTLGGFITAFMFPSYFANEYANSNWWRTSPLWNIEVERQNTIDGYTPKNNKLFTYPYVCANITNHLDDGKDFGYEFFSGDYVGADKGLASFSISAPLGANACLIAQPAGLYNGTYKNGALSVQSMPFPTCAFVPDKFTQWISNNALSLLAYTAPRNSGFSESKVREIFASHPVLEADAEQDLSINSKIRERSEINRAVRENAVNNLQLDNSATLTRYGVISALSALQGGNASGTQATNALFGTNSCGITFRRKTIKKYNAKIIDDYFTKYGYSICSIEQPVFNARESFTYIKTNGFSAHGGVPSDTLNKISKIHDNGITYWKKDKVLGDYSQSNRPISEVQNNG